MDIAACCTVLWQEAEVRLLGIGYTEGAGDGVGGSIGVATRLVGGESDRASGKDGEMTVGIDSCDVGIGGGVGDGQTGSGVGVTLYVVVGCDVGKWLVPDNGLRHRSGVAGEVDGAFGSAGGYGDYARLIAYFLMLVGDINCCCAILSCSGEGGSGDGEGGRAAIGDADCADVTPVESEGGDIVIGVEFSRLESDGGDGRRVQVGSHGEVHIADIAFEVATIVTDVECALVARDCVRTEILIVF